MELGLYFKLINGLLIRYALFTNEIFRQRQIIAVMRLI